MIYATKPFYIQHESTFLRLHEVLPRSSINAIQELHFIWPILGRPCFPDVKEKNWRWEKDCVAWIQAWEKIASMKGLKTLHVELNVPAIWRYAWRRSETVLLDSVMNVEVEDFVLWLPWMMNDEGAATNMRDLPCRDIWV